MTRSAGTLAAVASGEGDEKLLRWVMAGADPRDPAAPWLLTERPPWHREAACTAPEVNGRDFFPARGDMNAVARARRICAGCAAREQCLAYALAADPDLAGIWAGTSARERRRLRSGELERAA